jgi:hypothetical protein
VQFVHREQSSARFVRQELLPVRFVRRERPEHREPQALHLWGLHLWVLSSPVIQHQ